MVKPSAAQTPSCDTVQRQALGPQVRDLTADSDSEGVGVPFDVATPARENALNRGLPSLTPRAFACVNASLV